MSNYIEYNGKIAFHPGYYIKEIIEESGLTQDDFAKRLDTTPKNLSILVRGGQSLSMDIAMKLSRMLGTSINYWINLQNSYDCLIAEFNSLEELKAERKIFNCLDYKYFRDYFLLPNLPRRIDQQIVEVRRFLNVSTLSVLSNQDLAVSFRSTGLNLAEQNVIKANTMVQIAINTALKIEAPKYNKGCFERAIAYALTLTTDHTGFYPLIKKAFLESGVILVVLPNLPGSKINGATKKVGKSIMLMVNDRRFYSDTFWFTLFHEIGHIINGDFGVSFEKEKGEIEALADKYAEDNLISPQEYQEFLEKKQYDIYSIKRFANRINRDPGIVLGRLQNDGIISYDDWNLNSLRHKYKVKTS